MPHGSRFVLILAGVFLLFPAQIHAQELAPRQAEVQPRTPPPAPRAQPAPRVQTPRARPLTISRSQGQISIRSRRGDRDEQRLRSEGVIRDVRVGASFGFGWSRSPVQVWSTVYSPPGSLALVSIEKGPWVRQSVGAPEGSPVHVSSSDPPLEVHFEVRGTPDVRYAVEAVLYDGSSVVQQAIFDSQMVGDINAHSILVHLNALESGEYVLTVRVQDHSRGAISSPATLNLVVSN